LYGKPGIVHYNLGLIYKYRGEWAQSFEFKQKANALDPEDAAACCESARHVAWAVLTSSMTMIGKRSYLVSVAWALRYIRVMTFDKPWFSGRRHPKDGLYRSTAAS